ncbi:MAG: DNA mismatch repair protein MutS [Flavobacteriaceae bacterium]
MHFEIGQKVAVLDDVLKGTVVKIEGDSIEVEDTDGMLYRFDKSELVVIEKEQYELSKYSDISNSLFQQKVQETNQKGKRFKKQESEVVLEVDLHIHQLVKKTRGMDNFDMLSLQIETAKRKLEYAISKKIPKVIFIHGVGEGVLKNELIYLFKRYPLDYYEASYQKYGMGATEVYIYQNPKS